VGGEASEDRLRHGSALQGGDAFDAGCPRESLPPVVVGTLGTPADCDRSASTAAIVGTVPSITEPGIAERNIAHIPQVADQEKLSCVLEVVSGYRDTDQSAIPLNGEYEAAISLDAGIDAAAGETCDCCGGSGRHAHLRHLVCSECGGSGLVS